MSKLIDKLARLHTSRINAQNAGNYVAEPEIPTSQTDQIIEPNAETSNDFDALRRSSALREKSRRKPKGASSKSEKRAEFAEHKAVDTPTSVNSRQPAPNSKSTVGSRLEVLRVQAQALIDVDASKTALPLLFEMVAIAPTNPFPLQHLVRHYENVGDETLASLYRDRLKQVAPY